ncbi:MAG: tRNA uridine-5-carboxymethylaminomethyl(34) synthesis GTPase MnmE [bacterium]
MVDAGVYLREDTIVAVSTPPGRGAIAVLRLSGPQAIGLCQGIFLPRGVSGLRTPRRMVHGHIREPQGGDVIDDVLCAVFPAPHSYTGEDMAEIHCHGSEAVLKRMLELLYRMGARAAEPGEFTFRAVRTGKMDLAQAEAVASLIESKSQLARRMSLRMLEGAFSQDLSAVREFVVDMLVEIETQIEFPDDAMEESTGHHLQIRSEELIQLIQNLKRRAVREQRFEQGIMVVLAGRPNVGKSSLFNRLLGRERAIVTPHAGTTRDSIEGTIEIAGFPVTLIDTAGLRETQEEIEAIGITRSRELLFSSHIILFICEASSGLLEEETQILRELSNREGESITMLVANKADLGMAKSIARQMEDFPGLELVTASAIHEEGLNALEQKLETKIQELAPPETDSAFIVNARQERVLAQMMERAERSSQMLHEHAPPEIAAEELRLILKDIAELDGTGIAPDIINTIFSRFCIGK